MYFQYICTYGLSKYPPYFSNADMVNISLMHRHLLFSQILEHARQNTEKYA